MQKRGLIPAVLATASDTSLQQVQAIQVKDLKGTPSYMRLEAAWDSGKKVPQLIVKLHKDKHEVKQPDEWGATLDETVVHVERVIAYWSRTFKSAERILQRHRTRSSSC